MYVNKYNADSGRNRLLILTITLMLIISQSVSAKDPEQTSFKSPEAAGTALMTALLGDDLDVVLAMFDRKYETKLLGGDRINALENAHILGRAMQTRYHIEDVGRDRKAFILGSEDWPFPFELIKQKGRWRFDTEGGIEEVINRRVGRNELAAINNCYAYVEAQIQYATADRDGDQVREFAQKMKSSNGAKDGLYWEAVENEEQSPLGPLIAISENYLKGREPGAPFKGYSYKILTRQSGNAPGGRYDYIINGNMIAGFAMIAFPAEHGNSGVMTFMCNHQGVVYQRDLGPDSDLLAAAIEVYDPDDNWSPVDKPVKQE